MDQILQIADLQINEVSSLSNYLSVINNQFVPSESITVTPVSEIWYTKVITIEDSSSEYFKPTTG